MGPRSNELEVKIRLTRDELLGIKKQIAQQNGSPAIQRSLKQKAKRLLKRKKMYEQQFDRAKNMENLEVQELFAVNDELDDIFPAVNNLDPKALLAVNEEFDETFPAQSYSLLSDEFERKEQSPIELRPINFESRIKHVKYSDSENDEDSVLISIPRGNEEIRPSLRSKFMSIFRSKPDPAGPKSIDSNKFNIPRRVEPRIYFANERTFLKWARLAVTLSMMGVALITWASEHVTGCLLIVMGVILLIRSYIQFRHRLRMIQNREEGYFEDSNG
eukprot:76279_1